MNRVLLAGLYHQTNVFVSGETLLGDFETRRGERLLLNDAPRVLGVMDIVRERGWEILPVLDMSALSGATVDDAVLDFFWDEFRAVAEVEVPNGIDGVFLFLHGAMVSESFFDVEGEILWRIRGLEHFSGIPVCGVMDLHVNFTEAMARQADGLISYRDDLGMDARDAARDAALLLDGLMQTERMPMTLRERPPILWPPPVAVTDREPMLTLENRARELEEEIPDVSVINVLAGFPYSDIPEAGVCFSAIADGDIELARSALRELNVLASSKRHFQVDDLTIGEAVAQSSGQIPERTLLLEPSDDVENGASGNSRIVLAALIEQDVQDALMVIHDPVAVESMEKYRSGDSIEVTGDGEPVSIRGELISKIAGHSANSCVVVKVHGVTILLTETRTPVNNFELLRACGVDPEDYSIIVLKSSRELWPPHGNPPWTTFALDSPGPAPLRLERLPFRKVSRPVYPLDAL